MIFLFFILVCIWLYCCNTGEKFRYGRSSTLFISYTFTPCTGKMYNKWDSQLPHIYGGDTITLCYYRINHILSQDRVSHVPKTLIKTFRSGRNATQIDWRGFEINGVNRLKYFMPSAVDIQINIVLNWLWNARCCDELWLLRTRI